MEIKDSGSREEFSTGAVRDIQDDNKGRYDLLSPFAMHRLSVHMAKGAKKYTANNWMKGVPMHSFYDSAMRHMFDYMANRLMKVEQDEDHLAAAFWNLHGLIHTEEMIARGELPQELDDIAIIE